MMLTLMMALLVNGEQQWNEEEMFDELEVSPRLLSLDREIGQIAGLAMDSQHRLIAFHRGGRRWTEKSFNEKNIFIESSQSLINNSTIFIIDPSTGKVLQEHGSKQFVMPHGLTVDHLDNLWLTDVGLHQVFKYARDDLIHPLLIIGMRGVPGNDSHHLCKPTDVAVASNGDFFIADGYCNSRVMKFDQNGRFITSFGASNSADEPLDGEFRVPHSLALIEDMDLLCVADRDNERIQCFSAGLGHRSIPAGIFFTKAESVGRVFAIREKEHYLIGVTSSDGSDELQSQLFIMDMQTGKANTFAKGIENAHALAVNGDGKVYVGQMDPNEIVELTL